MRLVICDIDGTILEEGFGTKPHKELKPYPAMIERIKEYRDNGWEVLFLTGRFEEYEKITAQWLMSLGFDDSEDADLGTSYYLIARPDEIPLSDIPCWKAMSIIRYWNQTKAERIHVYDNEIANLMSLEGYIGPDRSDVKMWLVAKDIATSYY